MADERPLSFTDLIDYRQQLSLFCREHYRSVAAFLDGLSFKLDVNEGALGPRARHLSSSATCIESLLDCPRIFVPREAVDVPGLAADFSRSAVRRPHREWLSDEAARIYCRCRTLPLVVYHLPSYQKKIHQHINRILSQLELDPSRLAIGEASTDDPDPDEWYRPNAFHTYWVLYLLHAVRDRFPDAYADIASSMESTRFNLTRVKEEMLMWAQRTAGYQVALHASDSIKSDSDQLAWSVTILLKFGRDFQANLGQQDFIRYAFKCLFAHQNNAGIWRTGAALFHYPHSGNAYCYVYETFTVLLKSALTDRPEGWFLRQALLPYGRCLIKLWQYATSTQIPLLPLSSKGIGWSSGHRVNHSEVESWATASVFSFAQALRRLIAIWSRDAAVSHLKVSTAHGLPVPALADLSDRGDTWSTGGKRTAAMQLLTLFVNPRRLEGSGNPLEPDSRPISKSQARGAILFGPPGTSKTTLARCVADAIGWDYLEIHASHFVAEGLPRVNAEPTPFSMG